MRGRSRLVLGVLLALNAAAVAATQQLGRPASDEELKAVDISIAPDGAGLPPGQGTAKEGEALYGRLCAACHGPKGIGGPNDRLVGGGGTLRRQAAGEDRGELLAVGDHAVRLHATRHAVRRANVLEE